jgi:ABC-type multidrug transport system permease subunit
MIQIWAVYLRSMLIVKRRFVKTVLGIILSPLLYAVAFGWGIGTDLTVEGVSYLFFMLPGLMAMSGMTQSFSIGSEINITRFLTKQFEEFLLAPAKPIRIVVGFILFGMTKGLFSFLFMLLIALTTGAPQGLSPFIIIPVLLNCFLFASLGVFIALTVPSHRDMNSFNTFVILPMSFLAGTFFSLEKLPAFLRVLTKIIPLTHASVTIRGAFLSRPVPFYHYPALIGFAVVFFVLAVYQVRKAVD